MANGGNQKTVELVFKARKFIAKTIKEIKAKELNLTLKQKIDLAGTLNAIKNASDPYIKAVRSEIPVGLKNIEEEGNLFRAIYSESENLSINPEVFVKEVDKKTFFDCVKVTLGKAKKAIPEARVNEIADKGDPIKKITFQEIK